MLKKTWHILGDTRIAFFLLLAASATLLTGAFYAQHHYSLFRELNRMRIQDWFPVHWAVEPERVWWVPLLFLFMTGLGINTFICASNRMARLLRQRRTWPAGKFFHLLTPSLIHFIFLIIMLGHLTTFVAGNWQTIPLEADGEVAIAGENRSYRVRDIRDQFFPDASALHDRIAQTRVNLATADGETIHLAYTRPVLADNRFFLLDKVKAGQGAAKRKILPRADQETCNKANVYVEADKKQKKGSQRLLVVSDPGLSLIVTGLTLIMILMIGYFLFQANGTGKYSKERSRT
ncbi:hypothetical protein [Desulfosarcina alkanivorans]|nr:hypothetical protein [Desulfosarcina alkanivorans]